MQGKLGVSVKLRYQLRGLGIGMVLAALLMGVAAGDGSSMSDAEIRARALELGMVEGNSLKLTDIVPTQVPDSDEVQLPDSGARPTQAPLSDSEAVSTQEPPPGSDTPTQTPPDTDGASTQVSASNAGTTMRIPPSDTGDANVITITIEQGEIASEICVKLEEAGIIEDAAAFETYLCERNWSRSIRDGIYNIPLGTSMEEIAELMIRTP